MFGLIAVAGLRLSEAIELRISDFTGDGLLIRETKFRKSRFVPLHESTIAQIEHYLEARRKVTGHSDHLFVSQNRSKFAANTVQGTYRDVCERAGIGRTAGGTRPRLHDLRHYSARLIIPRRSRPGMPGAVALSFGARRTRDNQRPSRKVSSGSSGW